MYNQATGNVAMEVSDKSRLTDQAYWDEVFAGAVPSPKPSKPWRRLLPETPQTRQLWRHILPPLVPKGPAKVVELGSAPGATLLRWRTLFGNEVFGVDFSENGLKAQRELFALYGITDEHSIRADFLSDTFQTEYREAFDIVYSGGVIEHFRDPVEVVNAHLQILKPGGLLMISIPNIAGIYRPLLAKRTVDAHNLHIMRLERFRALFRSPVIQPLLCQYFGQLNLGVAYSGHNRKSRCLLRVQALANMLLRIVSFPENRWTSPCLLFIGRKRLFG